MSETAFATSARSEVVSAPRPDGEIARARLGWPARSAACRYRHRRPPPGWSASGSVVVPLRASPRPTRVPGPGPDPRRQHAAVGAQPHRGRRQRLAERRPRPGTPPRGFRGHRLLLVDDALHGAHFVGVDFVDHRPGDRDERGGGRDLEDGQPECVARSHDSVRHLTEGGSGVERERGDIGRGQPGDVVELLAVGGADGQAGGHHQLTAEKVRRGVGQLYGVRPGDGPVGVLPPGHQREPQLGVLRESARGDRHGPL